MSVIDGEKKWKEPAIQLVSCSVMRNSLAFLWHGILIGWFPIEGKLQ